MSKPNLANTEVLDSCPQCNGPIILIGDEWVCSNCGFRLLKWFDPDRPLVERVKEFHMKLRKVIEESEGSKGLGNSSTGFLVESPPPSSTATDGEGSSGPLNPSAIPDKRPPMKQGAEYPDEEATNLPHNDEVPGDPDEQGNVSPITFRSYGCTRLGLPAPPPFILTERDANRLMKGSCDVNEAPTPRSLSHGGPTGAAPLPFVSEEGCSPEAQQKLCAYYNVETHVCREDGAAWCLNPAAPVCWTRIDVERVKKNWPVYKGSQWKNNAECPVCGAKVNYEIASCETGCNYCCDEHATQHVKELTPDGGW